MSTARWWWCTAKAPGAIAVACVNGGADALDAVMHAVSGAGAPAVGQIAWRKLGLRGAAFDDGVIARVAPEAILLMPHGGARIAARLDEALAAAECEPVHEGAGSAQSIDDARATFPEAPDDVEALMLAELARAASPRAIDLLLAQPERWHAANVRKPSERDTQLNRLVTPARVLVVGPANAGKSTLLNALAGRAVAVVHDLPGTTRDAVAARIDLDGVVVDWFDTPGVRANPDAAEVHATAIAAELEAHADLVVQLTAPGLGWLPRARALRVLNKCDMASAAQCTEHAEADLAISAQRGDNLSALVARVRETLVPESALASTEPWWFSPALASATLEVR